MVDIDDTQKIPLTEILDMDIAGKWEIVHGRIDADCERLELSPVDCERIWRWAIEHYESVSTISKNG